MLLKLGDHLILSQTAVFGTNYRGVSRECDFIFRLISEITFENHLSIWVSEISFLNSDSRQNKAKKVIKIYKIQSSNYDPLYFAC